MGKRKAFQLLEFDINIYIYIYIYIYIFNSFKTIHKPRRELYNKTTTQVLSLMFEKKINGQFEKKIYSMFGMFAFSLKLY